MNYKYFEEYVQERYEYMYDIFVEGFIKDKKRRKEVKRHVRQLHINFMNELNNASTLDELDEVEKYLKEIIRRMEREFTKEELNDIDYFGPGYYYRDLKQRGQWLIDDDRVTIRKGKKWNQQGSE